MERQTRLGAGVLAILFVIFHLPFLPRTLEDLDSINFGLGLRDFDVTRHQPHPPGYPLFILGAKIARLLTGSEAHALAVLSVVSGALAIMALAALYSALDRRKPDWNVAIAATALAATTPLYWMTAVRPLSDMAGLAAALGVQALTVASPRALTLAAFLAAFGAGIRSQVIWLTVPLLTLAIGREIWTRGLRNVLAIVGPPLGAFCLGLLAWAIPLVALTGGPAAYWRTVFNQGAEDLTGIAMLWTTPTVRQAAVALYSTFLAPWAAWPLGVAVLLLAAIGFVRVLRSNVWAAVMLIAAFGPYFLFDVFFQENITTRYALPLVVPLAYFAAWGAGALPGRLAAALVVLVAVLNVGHAAPTVYGYSRQDAPAFRVLTEMAAAEAEGASSPVLAMHRREDFDLRRPFVWLGDRAPAFQTRLPAVAKHEWLEVVKYWNAGGRNPVWFIADPLRSDLALMAHGSARRYRWSLPFPVLIGGVRPNEMDWYSIAPPDWYLGEGWAVTPETAGLAKEDRRGPGFAPVEGWIRRWPGSSTLLIGGRNLEGGGPVAHVRFALDGRPVGEATVPPGFFVQMIDVAHEAGARGDYAALTVSSDVPQLAIEQFDAKPAGEVIFGYADGWHEQEYNPTTGRSWRWTSERALLQVRSSPRPLQLRLEGETETFSNPSHMVIRAGTRVLGEATVGQTFSVVVPLPADLFEAGTAALTIETDQTYVPAERRFRLRPLNDRRRLGLKVYECTITPSS